uniref:Uncharacterized protein n=1 Tax=Tanacetum cinerariifolium TaxID=118510 RepID=A0A6L2J631_TANCI|nr:hypothetical protein [Tanacetum cinerariifolium]
MANSSTSSNSEVSSNSNCSSSCLENVKFLKEQNEQLLKDLRTSKINVITYKTGLESVEARLLVYKKNKSVYEEDIKLLKFSEPTVKKPIVETSKAKASADKPKVVRKNFSSSLIDDWISNSEDEAESMPKIEKKRVKPSFAKIEFLISKEQVKSPRKTVVKQGYCEGETFNREGELQALVDGKKVIITESTIRRDLKLEDAEGVDCLPNAVIFERLTLMGCEKLSQKLTFYKAFFNQQ